MTLALIQCKFDLYLSMSLLGASHLFHANNFSKYKDRCADLPLEYLVSGGNKTFKCRHIARIYSTTPPPQFPSSVRGEVLGQRVKNAFEYVRMYCEESRRDSELTSIYTRYGYTISKRSTHCKWTLLNIHMDMIEKHKSKL